MKNDYRERALRNAPELFAENADVVNAYKLAVENLLKINTVPCPAETYNRTGLLDEGPGLMIRAGGTYPTPWTRDAAVNTMNAACFLEPEVAKNTLWAVCERTDGKLCFQTDNQSWDKIVWAAGAWKYYLATGDREFLASAYETVGNSLEMLEKHQFNTEYGLFTGGSFFNDGITGYPAELHEEGNESSFMGEHPAVKDIMTLSTNCLYYYAYRIMAEMAKLLGKTETAVAYAKKGENLKTAVNANLWKQERGSYSYLLYPNGRTDDSQEGCGISFAVLADICDEKQAAGMLKRCHRSARGLMSIWPPFAGISTIEKPLRHNNLIWPVVNGFFVTAAARYGLADIVGDEILNLALLVKNDNNSYSEIYNPETGLADGGWQCGHIWDSVRDQTWSATAFIRSIVFGVFGITLGEKGIAFHPCLPEGFGTVSLKGICFRDVEMDITLKGKGGRAEKTVIRRVDTGKTQPAKTKCGGGLLEPGTDGISFGQPGKYEVEIRLEAED